MTSLIKFSPTDFSTSHWLHGSLAITVFQATNVTLTRPVVITERGLMSKFLGDIQRVVKLERPGDTYCTIDLGTQPEAWARLARTHVVPQSINPVFEESFSVLVANYANCVCFKLKDAISVGAPMLGQVVLPASRLVSGMEINDWFLCTTLQNEITADGTSLHVRVKYIPIGQVPHGLRGDMAMTPARGGAVPDTFFPLRRGCQLTLYQDANQVPGTAPEVPLDWGATFQSRSYWDDLYSAICDAKHFIYVLGWDFNAMTYLTRAAYKVNGSGPWQHIGDLLKAKAEEGVRVLLLIWEDRTSSSMFGFKGVTNTHAQVTKAFFAGTRVVFKSRPRASSEEEASALLSLKTDWWFSHHEKCWTMDALQPKSCSREVIAFVGGLDVTTGRYDTRQHSLFRTLRTEHDLDFYQSCIPGATADHGGPRIPWHDIACRVSGPVAHDVMQHFEQRWCRQPKGEKYARLLVPLAQVTGASGRLTLPDPTDPTSWHAQLYRSVDSDSVELPKANLEAYSLGLATGKGKSIDASVHKAYVHAIRRAQHFIYIENQYFVGSSHLWTSNNNAGASHLVPAEIALKIVSKIRAGERFMAYIVLPMYPEGDPSSATVQEILSFQSETMRFMYGMIGTALAALGPAGAGWHPRDYLAFFCLGNREVFNPTWESPPAQLLGGLGLLQARAQQQRRFQIYVHSKLMIVDDEFLIMGSANLNMRSLDGTRDTEIAVGAFQPSHLAGLSSSQLPKGQVYGLRMSLWQEHTNASPPSFQQPASVQCARELSAMATANWTDWATQDHVVDLKGHLMTYPISVAMDGRIEAVPGCECFPDTEGKVLGQATDMLPDQLTT